MEELKIKRLHESAVVPTKGSAEAAGLDLYSLQDATIGPGETCMISSGISVEIPKGYFGGVYPRSGLSCKSGIRLANSVGVIDSDYRGAIGLPLHYDSDEDYFVKKGDRVAQLVIQPYLNCVPVEVPELTNTARGNDGFGSTGK